MNAKLPKKTFSRYTKKSQKIPASVLILYMYKILKNCWSSEKLFIFDLHMLPRLTHSCIPNAYLHIHREEWRLHVISLKHIVPGENIRISFIENLCDDYISRKKILLSHFELAECWCEACRLQKIRLKSKEDNEVNQQTIIKCIQGDSEQLLLSEHVFEEPENCTCKWCQTLKEEKKIFPREILPSQHLSPSALNKLSPISANLYGWCLHCGIYFKEIKKMEKNKYQKQNFVLCDCKENIYCSNNHKDIHKNFIHHTCRQEKPDC